MVILDVLLWTLPSLFMFFSKCSTPGWVLAKIIRGLVQEQVRTPGLHCLLFTELL